MSSKNVCLNCLKEVEGDLKCSRCRVARYCHRECQIVHWPAHKNICQDSNSEDSNMKLHMKARNHHEQGNYRKAAKLYTKLLDILRSTKGEDHPATLNVMNDLASAYDSQGKYDEAEVLYKQCLDKYKAVLGEEHPDTLITMYNLGSTYNSQGKNDEAEVLLKQCLDKSIVVIGENHPDTLGTMNNLAAVYESQGRYDEANALVPSTI